MTSTGVSEATVGAVFETIEARVDADTDGVQHAHGNVWTSRARLRADAEKPGTDYDSGDVDGALATLEAADRLVAWFGLLAPATPDHLRAIIKNEAAADYPRSLLVGRCNRLLVAVTDTETDTETDAETA